MDRSTCFASDTYVQAELTFLRCFFTASNSSCLLGYLKLVPTMAESDEKGEPETGHKETSPPGRETREDWKGSQRLNNGNDNGNKTDGNRSRSRSPINRGRRNISPGRGRRFPREGTNTISDEPHLQRARLFVGNIEPNRTNRSDLVHLFSRHGDVLGVSVHKGYAFVQMDRERNANKAVNYEDNRMFMGSRIRKSIDLLIQWLAFGEHLFIHLLLSEHCCNMLFSHFF